MAARHKLIFRYHRHSLIHSHALTCWEVQAACCDEQGELTGTWEPLGLAEMDRQGWWLGYIEGRTLVGVGGEVRIRYTREDVAYDLHEYHNYRDHGRFALGEG